MIGITSRKAWARDSFCPQLVEATIIGTYVSVSLKIDTVHSTSASEPDVLCKELVCGLTALLIHYYNHVAPVMKRLIKKKSKGPRKVKRSLQPSRR